MEEYVEYVINLIKKNQTLLHIYFCINICVRLYIHIYFIDALTCTHTQ